MCFPASSNMATSTRHSTPACRALPKMCSAAWASMEVMV